MRFLGDSPSDPQLPQLRLQVARDRLAWAAKPIGKALTRQELLTEVAARFATARTDLGKIVADFVKQKALQQEAQWDLANSFLTEARAVSAVSPTLARGQFVRAARELRAVAVKYPGHPQIGQIAPLLWNIAQEMERQGYEDESVLVWNELAISDPMNPLAQQAIDKIAQTYRGGLKRPLKAAETYVELNFIRGGSDAATQEAVFQIGASLKNEKRWVEALQVLETFVDSFPRHAQAGQALTMIGQIHQTNQAWEDAIKAYRRVIDEYKGGQWAQEAKWSIAECRINLSQWKEATEAYRDYVANTPAVGNVNMPAVNPISYPGGSQQGQTAKPQQGAPQQVDPFGNVGDQQVDNQQLTNFGLPSSQGDKLAEANRRLDILKDLARFQELIDEKGQRKAFDAQFQIATIVRTQLANPVKGIIEYRKVVTNWPDCYVAATALNEIGNSYLALGETAKAREAYMAVAKDYPTSPLAGAALFQVGKSYEDEADKLATLTREKTVELAKEQAQSKAYQQAQFEPGQERSGPERARRGAQEGGQRRPGRSGRGQGGLQPEQLQHGQRGRLRAAGAGGGGDALGLAIGRPPGQDQRRPAEGDRGLCGRRQDPGRQQGRRRLAANGQHLRPAFEGLEGRRGDLDGDRPPVQRHLGGPGRKLEAGPVLRQGRQVRRGHRGLQRLPPQLPQQPQRRRGAVRRGRMLRTSRPMGGRHGFLQQLHQQLPRRTPGRQGQGTDRVD